MTLRRTWKRYRPLLPVLAAGLVGVALLPGGRHAPVMADAISAAPVAAAVTQSRPAQLPEVALVMPVRHQSREAAASSAAWVSPTADAHPPTPSAALYAGQAHAALAPAPSAAVAASGRSGHIGDVDVNVHSGPSDAAQTLFVADAGEQVAIKSTQGGWVEIVLPDGGSGWVYGRFVADGV